MILFSDRRNAELEFHSWCRDTGARDCPLNFVAWLQATQSGKKLIIELYGEIIENLAGVSLKAE